jgi:carbonic anhydrase
LRANAEFVAAGVPALGADDAPELLVIAASSPGLAGLLDAALGLERGRAVVIQLADAWGGRDGEDLERSLLVGLHQYGCREILVVGDEADPCLQPDRQLLRARLREAGLEPDSAEADRLLEMARRPADPEAAVRETVRWLRTTPLVPTTIPIQGGLVRAASGRLDIVDRDRRRAGAVVRASLEAPDSAAAPSQSSAPEVPLPDLPEISLPEIPALDLDRLAAGAQTSTPESAESVGSDEPAFTSGTAHYGQHGAGPVDLETIGKPTADDASLLPPEPGLPSKPDERRVPEIATAEVEFHIPETAAIQDTGLGDAEALRPGQPELPERGAEEPPSPQRPSRPPPRPAPPRDPERPEVTPIVRQPQAQRPLGEQEIDFGQAGQPPAPAPRPTPAEGGQNRGRRADLQSGEINERGERRQLDPELQRALVKLSGFLRDEFSAVDRNQIFGRIRKASHQGQPTSEQLKLMISPVLKLGRKRYAVINELLKIKEELPRQSPDVSLDLLEQLLTDR